jgi:hypothetical protein
MQKSLLGIVSTLGLLTLGVLTACGGSSTTIDGPTVEQVTPTVSDNGDGTFNCDLVVDFDDSADTGDLVDEYTFSSTGVDNDMDVTISPASTSPVTINGITLPMDDSGNASVAFELTLFGATTGIGSVFDGTINVTQTAKSPQ